MGNPAGVRSPDDAWIERMSQTLFASSPADAAASPTRKLAAVLRNASSNAPSSARRTVSKECAIGNV